MARPCWQYCKPELSSWSDDRSQREYRALQFVCHRNQFGDERLRRFFGAFIQGDIAFAMTVGQKARLAPGQACCAVQHSKDGLPNMVGPIAVPAQGGEGQGERGIVGKNEAAVGGQTLVGGVTQFVLRLLQIALELALVGRFRFDLPDLFQIQQAFRCWVGGCHAAFLAVRSGFAPVRVSGNGCRAGGGSEIRRRCTAWG